MDSGEDDFAVSGVGESGDLVDDIGEGAAGEFRPDHRDDAVAAAEQTAVLDFDVGPLPSRETGEAGGDVEHAEPRHQVREFSFVGEDFRDAGEFRDLVGGSSGARVA